MSAFPAVQLPGMCLCCCCCRMEDGADAFEADCKIVEHLLDFCEITVPEENRFFVRVNCGGIQHSVIRLRKANYADITEKNGLSDGRAALAFSGDWDFGHTSAEWDSIISLGIFGLRKRIDEYAQKHAGDEKKSLFYKNLAKIYKPPSVPKAQTEACLL